MRVRLRMRARARLRGRFRACERVRVKCSSEIERVRGRFRKCGSKSLSVGNRGNTRVYWN